MIAFACPSCRKALSAPDAAAGQSGRCACGAGFVIPRPAHLPPPLPRSPGPAPPSAVGPEPAATVGIDDAGKNALRARTVGVALALTGALCWLAFLWVGPAEPRAPGEPAPEGGWGTGAWVLAAATSLALFAGCVAAVRRAVPCTTPEALAYTVVGLVTAVGAVLAAAAAVALALVLIGLVLVVAVVVGLVIVAGEAAAEEDRPTGRRRSGGVWSRPGSGSAPPVDRTCHSCGGSGNGEFACHFCGGRGNDGTNTCVHCRGRGSTPCSSCGGTGRDRW